MVANVRRNLYSVKEKILGIYFTLINDIFSILYYVTLGKMLKRICHVFYR